MTRGHYFPLRCGAVTSTVLCSHHTMVWDTDQGQTICLLLLLWWDVEVCSSIFIFLFPNWISLNPYLKRDDFTTLVFMSCVFMSFYLNTDEFSMDSSILRGWIFIKWNTVYFLDYRINRINIISLQDYILTRRYYILAFQPLSICWLAVSTAVLPDGKWRNTLSL